MTLNQVIRGHRKVNIDMLKRRDRHPALEGNPQKKGVCVRVFTAKPKKPNSAVSSDSRFVLLGPLRIR